MNTLHTAPQASLSIRLSAAACAAAITLVLLNAAAWQAPQALHTAAAAAKPAPLLVASR